MSQICLRVNSGTNLLCNQKGPGHTHIHPSAIQPQCATCHTVPTNPPSGMSHHMLLTCAGPFQSPQRPETSPDCTDSPVGRTHQGWTASGPEHLCMHAARVHSCMQVCFMMLYRPKLPSLITQPQQTSRGPKLTRVALISVN